MREFFLNRFGFFLLQGFYLIPEKTYAINITASGYGTINSILFPDPDAYGIRSLKLDI